MPQAQLTQVKQPAAFRHTACICPEWPRHSTYSALPQLTLFLNSHTRPFSSWWFLALNKSHTCGANLAGCSHHTGHSCPFCHSGTSVQAFGYFQNKPGHYLGFTAQALGVSGCSVSSTYFHGVPHTLLGRTPSSLHQSTGNTLNV